MSKTCETCRWFDRFSTTSVRGVCRRDHRYSRVKMPDGQFAHLDSFGAGEEVHERETCGAHDTGERTLKPKDADND